MSQKLLHTSSKLIHEQTEVSLRTLKDSSIILANTAETIINCENVDYVRINLQADTKLSFINANKEGQQIVVALYQYDTIVHDITLDFDMVRLGTDIWSVPQLSKVVGKLDRLIFTYDAFSQKYDLVGYSRGY